MATVTRNHLSGSSNGRGIKVAATATPGTTIHTAVNSAGQFDEIWIWAVNTSTTPRKLTIEWGGTTAPDDLIEQTVPPESGLIIVIPGLFLDTGSVVRAFAETADVLVVHGYANTVVN